MSDIIENAEILDEGNTPNTDGQKSETSNDKWRKATKTLWNGAIFNSVLILLCAVLVFFFPKEEMDSTSFGIGLGTLLVYFMALTLTALGAINTYQKGLYHFSTMFAKDGVRALDVIRWGFMLAMMGVLFHFFIFYLPLIDPATKHLTSTLLIGNSIVILSAIVSIVGFLMLATANGCPDPARKGSLLMIVASLVLLAGAFLAPFAIATGGWSRIVELIVLLGGDVLFLVSWHRIVRPRTKQEQQE